MPLNTSIRGAQISTATISGGHLLATGDPSDGQVLTWDATQNKFTWANLGSMEVNEVPSGLINGSNTAFTLSNTPISGSEMIHLNGLLQEEGGGNDYTITGSGITMIPAPETNDILLATYLTSQGLGSVTALQNVVEDLTPQLGGDLDLNGNNIDFTAILTVNGTYEGEIMDVTVDDASAAFGNTLYCASDGNYDRADASASGTMPCRALSLESGAGAKDILLKGQVCDTSWNWASGSDVYVSTTSGVLTQTKPSATGEQVQIVGYALSADTILFNPQYALVEIA